MLIHIIFLVWMEQIVLFVIISFLWELLVASGWFIVDTHYFSCMNGANSFICYYNFSLRVTCSLWLIYCVHCLSSLIFLEILNGVNSIICYYKFFWELLVNSGWFIAFIGVKFDSFGNIKFWLIKIGKYHENLSITYLVEFLYWYINEIGILFHVLG